MSGKPIKPRGRPPTTPGESRPTGSAYHAAKGLVSIHLWMTPEQRDRVRSDAECAGMSIKDYCLQKLLNI
jgi:hypothetical protein